MTENIERKQIRALHSMILEYLSKTHENQADISWTDFLASNRNHGVRAANYNFNKSIKSRIVEISIDPRFLGKIGR